MNTTFLFASLAVSAILAGVFAVAKIKVIERKARAGRTLDGRTWEQFPEVGR